MPIFKRSLWMVLGIAVIALGVTAYFLAARPEDAVRLDAGTAPEKAATVTVHVTGAVKRPGVFELPPGSRIERAVEAAGGALPTADLEGVNLAKELADGVQVRVPERTEAGGSGARDRKAAPSEGKININTADAQELDKLPGIGPVMAKRIIEYRSGHGAFEAPEDIQKVRGIGPATYEKMKDKVTI